MNRWKTHIKRDGKKTFCGIGWTVWRNCFRSWHGQNDIVHQRPKEALPLPTGKYNDADCQTCIKSFKLLAQIISEEGNLLSLLTLGQQHETRFMPKYYPESIQYGA